MTSSSVKVLVSGSVDGQFADFFDRISATNDKHGPFDVLLCTGNFFAADTQSSSIDDLVSGKVTVPLTTYFIQGGDIPAPAQERIDSNDGEICENLYYLGKKGTMTTTQGLKIAFLSGTNNQSDIDTLKNTKMPITAPVGVDVLLTTEWPKGIEDNSTKAPSSLSSDVSSLAIAELALALKPRYHFATSANLFYEREPYKNTTGFGGADERPAAHASRFIGLGKALNKDKQRWFYAYNIVPMAKATPDVLNAIPPLTTDTPFFELTNHTSAGKKRGALDDNSGFFWGEDDTSKKRRVPPSDYVCVKCQVPGHYVKDCPIKHELPPGYVCNKCNIPGHFVQDCPNAKKSDLDSCWFCLANPKLEKHLITSIGSEVYATLAKGPLVSSKSSPVPGGGHSLLVSIVHHPTFSRIPDESRDAVKSDLDNYKKSLRELFSSYGQDAAIYEVSRESVRSHSHAHIQVVPIPKELSANVESVARQEAEAEGYTFVDEAPEGASFFDLELPNGKHLVHVITPRVPFNLQFGRTVLAKALGQPDRGDWRRCAQTEEEERQAATEFKEAFKKFDANSS